MPIACLLRPAYAFGDYRSGHGAKSGKAICARARKSFARDLIKERAGRGLFRAAAACPNNHMAKKKKPGRRHDATGRSQGASYFGIDRWVMRTAAWLDLRPAERAVYLELEYRHNGSNNGLIRLSCREAAECCRMNKDTASRALVRLEELGFIRTHMQGAFSLKKRHASEYELTRHSIGGEPASKAFAQWRPEKKSRSQNKAAPVPSIRTVKQMPAEIAAE